MKVRHKSGSALVAVQTQGITRWNLELMKHSTKETFLNVLKAKVKAKVKVVVHSHILHKARRAGKY